ncbi:MAG: hypothetical protein HY929_08385, partial [Euryarchaeota archaeon]|nr:hypothetical protein [Euryarchaeota archaeon]
MKETHMLKKFYRQKNKENDELEIIYDKVLGLMKPVKEMKVKETAGILGPADEDEVTFATLDPELLTIITEKSIQGRRCLSFSWILQEVNLSFISMLVFHLHLRNTGKVDQICT